MMTEIGVYSDLNDSYHMLRLPHAGRVIDWSIAFLKTASGASSVYEVDYATLVQNMGGSSSKVLNCLFLF